MAAPAKRPPDIIEFVKSEEYLGPNDRISTPQIAALKALYGPRRCSAMTPEELDAFLDMSDGVKPRAAGYSEAVLIIGQRSGKTDMFLANVAVYDGFTCDLSFLSPGEDAYFPLVAQDADRAMQARGYIEGKLLLLEERDWDVLEHGSAQEKAVTGKQVRCRRVGSNGKTYRLIYQCFPCQKASTRGITAIGWGGDEVAWWRTAEGAYNPDVEIIRALQGRVATVPFQTHGVIVTSPYGEEGVAFDRYQRRFKLRNSIVLNTPSWVFNPNINMQVVKEAQEDDPTAAARDFGAQFGKAGGSYLEPNDVDKVIGKTRPEIIPHQHGFQYAAAIDVAHKHDLYALAIGHLDDGSVPFDCIETRQGTRKAPLDDTVVAGEYAEILSSYGIDTVIGDQHFDLQIVKEYEAFGIKVIIEPQTDVENYELFKNLKAVIRRGLTSFPDKKIVRDDLLSLRVIRMGQKGKPKIAAPDRAGFHDDVSKAVSVVLMKLLPLGAGADLEHANRGAMPDRQRLFKDRGFPLPAKYEREDSLPTDFMSARF